MNQQVDLSKGSISVITPTMELRWIERQHVSPIGGSIRYGYSETVLQQKYLIRSDEECLEEWRDIPVVKE